MDDNREINLINKLKDEIALLSKRVKEKDEQINLLMKFIHDKFHETTTFDHVTKEMEVNTCKDKNSFSSQGHKNNEVSRWRGAFHLVFFSYMTRSFSSS